MDELLRVLLPLSVVSTVRPHQYLPAAVDSEEVPGWDETGPVATGRRPHATPDVLRSLDLGSTGGGEDQNDKSRMTGDCHVRFRGSPGVRFPRATRLDEVVVVDCCGWCSFGLRFGVNCLSELSLVIGMMCLPPKIELG